MTLSVGLNLRQLVEGRETREGKTDSSHALISAEKLGLEE